jgi:hypothetical protein
VTLCILERYLLQLYEYNGVNLKTTILDHHRTNFIQVNTNGHKDDSQYHLVRSMLTYISHNTGGLPDGTFLIAEDKAPRAAQVRLPTDLRSDGPRTALQNDERQPPSKR